HGLGDHLGTAANFLQSFAHQGYQVTGFDMRGHGKSTGKRTHLPDFSILIDDLKRFLEHIKSGTPAYPTFVIGYDLGALLALAYVQKFHGKGLSGLICLSPLFHPYLHSSVWQSRIYALKSRFLPMMRITLPHQSAQLSHDLEAVERWHRDPLCSEHITLQTARNLQQMSTGILLKVQQIRTPTLFLQAGDDRITDIETFYRFVERIPSYNKKVQVYPGYLHALHLETPDRKSLVQQDVLSWLNDQHNT
ncbi:MAG: lysophospholipase, partial [Myxococcota bacterium]